MKPESEWYVSPELKRIYQERVKDKGITQAEFAKRSGIGTQTLISMLLNRDRSITPQNAVKFCQSLHCTIYDVCPEMGEFLTKELFPYLGKALRKAAMFGALSIGGLLSGAFDNNTFAATYGRNLPIESTYCTMRAKFYRFLRWLTFQKLTGQITT